MNLTTTKIKIKALYLEYVNDFLTVTRFAEYYRITELRASKILSIGHKLTN